MDGNSQTGDVEVSRGFFDSPFIEKAVSPLWTLLLLAMAAFFVAFWVLVGPYHTPWILWSIALTVFCQMVLRLLYDLTHINKPFRYPKSPLMYLGTWKPLDLSLDEAEAALASQGYAVDRTRLTTYGERRNAGFWAGLAMNAAFAVMLLTGLFNFSLQYEGRLLMGYNQTSKLNNRNIYTSLTQGILREPEDLQLSIRTGRIFAPTKDTPRGAAEVNVLDEGGDVVAKGTMKPGDFLNAGGMEVHFLGLSYELWFSVLDKEGGIFGGTLNMSPPSKTGDMYRSGFVSRLREGWNGEVTLDPVKREFRTVVRNGDTVVYDGPVPFTTRTIVLDEKTGMIARVGGYRREITLRVSWSRVLKPLYGGAAVLLLATLLRLFMRPRRAWLRVEDGQVKLRATDRRIYKSMGGGQ